jgi:acyl-CoA thioesterase YciA
LAEAVLAFQETGVAGNPKTTENKGRDGGPSPGRDPALRTFAMPKDANPNGDIFGGWIMAQMDLAGAVAAVRRARGRVATVAVEAMEFHRPVSIGDLVSCYAEVTKVGRSSMRVEIETWVERRMTRVQEKVTAGTFTYVAIDEQGRPRPVDLQAGE